MKPVLVACALWIKGIDNPVLDDLQNVWKQSVLGLVGSGLCDCQLRYKTNGHPTMEDTSFLKRK